MRWIVRLLVLYAVALMVVVAVAIVSGATTPGTGQPAHTRMDEVSHSDYQLHRSIGHVP